MAHESLAGRYRFVRAVARPDDGRQWEAVDETSGDSVSLTLLDADGGAEAARRLCDEARRRAALDHPGILPVREVGLAGETVFVASDPLPGPTLAQVIEERGPLPSEEVMSYADQVCAALAHAHANGVVHLGLDPTALVLGADGSVRVTGFAVPRPLRGRTPAVSGADGPVREAYRAPEEAPDGPVDERADLYALGCVLTALLTGRPPFEGDTVHDLVEQHRRVPPRLRDVPPDTSELVDALVADMLAKRPQDRPASAVEVRIRLVGGQVPGSGPGLADAGEEGVPSGPRRSWSVLLPVYVLVAGLLLTGALVIVATHGHALLRLL